MNTNNVNGYTEMSNAVCSLLQQSAVGKADKLIDRILCDSADTSVYIPDESVDVHGYADCRAALLKLNETSYGHFDLTHSHAYKTCEDGSVMGHYNTYTYDIDTAGGKVRYSYWRITVTFVPVGESWKLKTFSKLKLLHVEPWEYDTEDEPGLIDRCAYYEDAPAGSISPQDYVECRNLAGHLAQDGIFNCKGMFSLKEDLSLYLPDLMEQPAEGRSAVFEAIDRIQLKEQENLNMYGNLTALCTPVIVSDGLKSHAVFLAVITNFRGPAYGYPEAPYRCQYRLARAEIDFARENNVWTVYNYRTTLLCKLRDLPFMNIHHDGSDGVPGRIEYMSRIPNRNFAPMWRGRKDSAEDIFEIESILPQWTERLKRNDLPDFPDMYMTNTQHDLVIQLSRSFLGSDAVRRHCNHLINEMYEGHETMWNNPQFHTGCAPVIEIADDGLSAESWYIDKCWGNIGAAAFYDNEINRKYYPGWGTYCHKFVKENGKWRLWFFGWTPTVGWSDDDPYRYTYDYVYGETGGWSVDGNGRQWPLPFEDFRY